MLAKLLSFGLQGIEGFPVIVEVNISEGMPLYELVGLPDAAVKESRERVHAALGNSGFMPPVARITINLAPADTRKEGPAFDLPLALGILRASGQLTMENGENEDFRKRLYLGELALDGEVRPVRGALPKVIAARAMGVEEALLPAANAAEAACIEGVRVIPVASLREAVGHLSGAVPISPVETKPYAAYRAQSQPQHDLSAVRGQWGAKRALEIAAAGGHNLLMIGPPGSGKTMLARCLPGILPDMAFEEALETTRIHSAAGQMQSGGSLMAERPFRSPHHTASAVALVGGGAQAKPGEISLAHGGVLFLDELPEYSRVSLEAMRQPLEDGFVSIARINAQARYPARVMLVASMNPCPCGNYGSADKEKKCRCDQNAIRRYLDRISGPLLDRIDLQLQVEAVPVRDIAQPAAEEASELVRARVNAAREIQRQRFADTPGQYCNTQLTTPQLDQYCPLDEAGKQLLFLSMEKYRLSMRAYTRLIKVARTIADLASAEHVAQEHIAEAIQYRSLDPRYWGN
ncbi:MAG: YifB family Mg chelatase-like AAA ATPase [Clostridia bacterium]|nr:YifB family Mg chelatase-like AAA ATPase [Clostridia bacterium]